MKVFPAFKNFNATTQSSTGESIFFLQKGRKAFIAKPHVSFVSCRSCECIICIVSLFSVPISASEALVMLCARTAKTSRAFSLSLSPVSPITTRASSTSKADLIRKFLFWIIKSNERKEIWVVQVAYIWVFEFHGLALPRGPV